jgi:uncharacterized protein GlcG (DUF336 family)
VSERVGGDSRRLAVTRSAVRRGIAPLTRLTANRQPPTRPRGLSPLAICAPAFIALLLLPACGGGGASAPFVPPAEGICRGGARDGQMCTDIAANDTGCPGGMCFAGVALQADEVAAIMNLAATTLNRDLVVAVTDRRGVVLGVGTNFAFDYDAACNAGPCPAVEMGCPAAPTPVSDCRAVDLAVQLARTAAFFSADQTPLTSRSVRFLSGEHFPPGIANAAAAALFGIENTNRGCSFDAVDDPLALLIPRAVSLPAVLRQRAGEAPLRCESSDDPDAHCGCTTGIATIPGAVPIYRTNPALPGNPMQMAGGIGVVLRGVEIQCDPVAALRQPGGSTSILRLDGNNPDFTQMELAARAYAGDNTGLPNLTAHGFKSVCASDVVPKPACCTDTPACDFDILASRNPPFDPVIFVDGIEIPEVGNPSAPPGTGTFAGISTFIVDPATLVPNDPLNSAQPVPIGWLVPPRDASAGAAPLSAGNVADIIDRAYTQSGKIRAAIRLPLPARVEMVLGIADTNDTLLGLFRMNDATVFSIDVAVGKAHNLAWLSSPDVAPIDISDCPDPMQCNGLAFPLGTALTNRTISFGAQPFFPSGINGTRPGPFRSLFIYDSANPCTNGHEPPNGRQNGIVFFPGSAPLYTSATLVGGFGVSGDGVEQDDLVSFAGVNAAPIFTPPARIRADQYSVRGVRLPYLKFNRRPFE